jgi:hypothetical protein
MDLVELGGIRNSCSNRLKVYQHWWLIQRCVRQNLHAQKSIGVNWNTRPRKGVLERIILGNTELSDTLL